MAFYVPVACVRFVGYCDKTYIRHFFFRTVDRIVLREEQTQSVKPGLSVPYIISLYERNVMVYFQPGE